MSLLEVLNLKAYYIMDVYGIKRTVRAVDDISINVEENEIYGVAGESGCGKTTLIKVLSEITKPPLVVLGGEVIYDFGDGPIDILRLEEDKLRKLRWERLSYIPQGSMNVLNPVRRIHKTFFDFIGAHRRAREREHFKGLIRDYLGDLGLPPEVFSSYPHQLSGGMRQRTTLALATILTPRVILADEPTTALDVLIQRGVIQLLKKIHEEQRNTLIVVTHDMAVHANITDRLAIMYAGKIVEEASTEELFENPLHPYTQYLIGSLPKIGDKSYKVSAPGAPPSLAHLPDGCRFHPRCPHAMDICKSEHPELRQTDLKHRVACFLHQQDRDER
jgi:peptide/nickel transport system ATP-binding protein